MRVSLLEPELRQAMVKALGRGFLIEREGPRVKWASFVRNGRAERLHKVDDEEACICRSNIQKPGEVDKMIRGVQSGHERD
jgi:hypothetical protein